VSPQTFQTALAFVIGSVADPSPPSSAEVKNAWSYTSTAACVFIGVLLDKAQVQLDLTSTGSVKLDAEIIAQELVDSLGILEDCWRPAVTHGYVCHKSKVTPSPSSVSNVVALNRLYLCNEVLSTPLSS
jgi:hypothetical protein